MTLASRKTDENPCDLLDRDDLENFFEDKGYDLAWDHRHRWDYNFTLIPLAAPADDPNQLFKFTMDTRSEQVSFKTAFCDSKVCRRIKALGRIDYQRFYERCAVAMGESIMGKAAHDKKVAARLNWQAAATEVDAVVNPEGIDGRQRQIFVSTSGGGQRGTPTGLRVVATRLDQLTADRIARAISAILDDASPHRSATGVHFEANGAKVFIEND